METVAGGKPVEQQPSGDLVDALVAPEPIIGEAKKISPDEITDTMAGLTNVPPEGKERRIIAAQSGVKLYSRPSMVPDAVIGTLPPNMSFEIRGTVKNPFGEFYKLKDGRYVSLGDSVKEI